MAKKKEKQESADGVLSKAAKTIGATAGTIVAAVGLATPPQPKVPKLVKKNKSRLPRREKKAAKKALQAKKVAE